MSNDNSQRMRISLPPGTKVRGEKETYTVKNFICMSGRAATVLCEASNGHTYRLKLYNGQHSITGAVQKRTMSVITKGVIAPVDIGEYGGCPFAVYQNVDATDSSKYPISQNILVQRMIPQLTYVVNMYHQNRILLRDLCPEHVLYKVQEQQIAYCGFNNMAILADKATITKENGYGQHPSFIAPEVPKYGYSTCSDYYSLGVTLLSMMLGKNPMQAMTWDEIQKHLQHGKVPGIDINHLRSTPYELYSEEDKVLYLVLGLMLPNPKDRWGYGEIRCWCNNQHIPLTRKEGRIPYQYNEPFPVNGYRCWNYQQLTQRMAAEQSVWVSATFKQLDQFAKRQNITGWNQIQAGCQDKILTASSRIFRAIYGINPALDGFWWEGKKYTDTSDLIREAATNQTAARTLKEILETKSLSYFLKMRQRVSAASEAEISEIEQIEQWEISEPGKGMNRCVMRFADTTQKRSFWIDGKEYQDLDQLVREFCTAGLQLKNISTKILKNKNFQAWLWANGMEDAGTEAQKIGQSHPEQSFYLLLKIAESAAKSEDAKCLARKIYLTYGEYAPVFWLINHISEYKMVSIGDQIRYDMFENANVSLKEPMERLSAKISQLVLDYQHFVSRTAKSPLDVECVDLEFCDFSFYPSKEDGFFCCTWENNLEVTPAFLRSIGGQVQKKKLDEWMDASIKAAEEKLETIIAGIPTGDASTPDKAFYIGQCNLNMGASVVMLLVVFWLFSWFLPYGMIRWWPCAVAPIFPIAMLLWYYQKRARADAYFYKKSSNDLKRAQYQELRDSLDQRGRDCLSRINRNTPGSLTLFQNGQCSTVGESGEIDLLTPSDSMLLVGGLSAVGIFTMCYLYSGILFFIIVNSVLVGYLIIANRIKSCWSWSISTGMLLIPLLLNLFYIGTFATVILEIILGAIVWTINKAQ